MTGDKRNGGGQQDFEDKKEEMDRVSKVEHGQEQDEDSV
jgi:hypothetical protein